MSGSWPNFSIYPTIYLIHSSVYIYLVTDTPTPPFPPSTTPHLLKLGISLSHLLEELQYKSHLLHPPTNTLHHPHEEGLAVWNGGTDEHQGGCQV